MISLLGISSDMMPQSLMSYLTHMHHWEYHCHKKVILVLEMNHLNLEERERLKPPSNLNNHVTYESNFLQFYVVLSP